MHCFLPRLLAVTVLLLLSTTASAENWPQWRGPRMDGISHDTGVPHTWSKTENVLWRLPLAGPAGATPAIWGDHIFLTSAEGSDLWLQCVSTDGRELWKKMVGSGNKAVRNDEGNYASPSPSTDGRHVWSFMGTGDLACFDFAGKEVWKTNLQKEYGAFQIQFGMASTPVLDGDRLYFQLIHSGGAIVLALDKATGKNVWKASRPSDARMECEHSYASPTLYRDGERAFLLTHGADYIIAHDLKDGHELWRCGGLNPPGNYNPTLRFVASPVAVPGLIVVPSAKKGPVFGLGPDLQGDITDHPEKRRWTLARNTPDVSSPLVHDGLVYLCREEGTLGCLDAKTGEELYAERVHSARHRGSPVFADGKIFLTGRDGRVTVIKPGRTFEVLARNDIGEEISASPAIADGRIYLRSFDALWAIGGR